MFVLVDSNQIKQFGLPQTGTLKNGSTVSRFDLLPLDILAQEGWFPLENNKSIYDETTEMLQFQSYEFLEDKVIANYIAVPIPQVEV